MESTLGFRMVIRCMDLDRSSFFYSYLLDLKIVEEWNEKEGRGCIFGFGTDGSGGQLEIYEMTEEDQRFHPAFRTPLNNDKIDIQLKCASLDEWIIKLKGKVDFDGPVLSPWGRRWIRFRDPDNLLIAIYEDNPGSA